MKDRVTALQTLGAKAAAGLEAFTPERAAAIQRAEQGFLQRPEQPRARLERWHLVVFAGAVLLALLVPVSSLVRPKARLSFRVDERGGRTNDQISALNGPVLMSFSDGSEFKLTSSTRAHVVSLEEHGAVIALESGSLDANVNHTGVSAWSLSAGPFAVRVTGTKFVLRWDPDLQRFSIRVTQGSVAVSGSVVGAERPVRSGETLLVSLPDRHLQLTNEQPTFEVEHEALTPTAMPTPTASSAAAAAASTSLDELVPKPRGANPLVLPNASAWRALALQGKMREAHASTEVAGFERACESANAADLLLLGDVARLAGRTDHVNLALLQLRRRFPTDPRSAAAAFMLGKVAFDGGGANRRAAEWFATSLREQPKGSLAREAAGRLIEALQRAGDVKGARRAAEDYLTSYPDGPTPLWPALCSAEPRAPPHACTVLAQAELVSAPDPVDRVLSVAW